MKVEFSEKLKNIEAEDKVFLGGSGLDHRFVPHNMSVNSYL